MAQDKLIQLPYFGPWRGLNEWPGECGSGEVEDAWNVEFRGDLILSRRGRQLIYQPSQVRPTRVLYYAGDTGVPVDDTETLTDGDTSTTVLFGVGATDAVYIGFPFPANNLFFTVSTANTNASAVSVNYNAVNGLTAVANLVDTTSSGGKTMVQSGNVGFTMPSDWAYTAPPHGAAGPFAYWLQLKVSNNLSGTTALSELTAALTVDAKFTGINGAFHWRRSTGERILIIGLDDKTNGVARLVALDRYTGVLKPFEIPGALAKSGPDAKWCFAAINDCLVAGNGYCFLRTVDPTKPYTLDGWKAASLKSTSSRQVTAPTHVSSIAVYKEQIFVVERDTQVVQFSDPIGAVFDFDGTSTDPLGGCTVWDVTNNFSAVDPSGAGPTCMIPQGSRLLILTPGSTHSWDGYAHQIIDPDVGCIAPQSLRSAENTVFFLGSQRVYRNDGGRNVAISKRIEPTLTRMDWLAARDCVAEVYHRRRQYRLHLPLGTQGKNTHALVYNYERDHWDGKFGVPTYNIDWETAAYMVPYEVAQTLAARDDEWDEELLTFDYAMKVRLEDSGFVDQRSASSTDILSVEWALAFDRSDWEDHRNVELRFARLECEGSNDQVIQMYAAADGRSPLMPNAADIASGVVQDPTALILDKGQAVCDSNNVPLPTKQCFGNAGQAGVTPGVDVWRRPRFDSYRFDLGLDGRYFQVGITSAGFSSGHANVPLRLRGMELDLRIQAMR